MNAPEPKGPEVDIVTPLLGLPFWTAMRVVNTLLQGVDMRRLGEVCHEHGVRPAFAFSPDDPEESR